MGFHSSLVEYYSLGDKVADTVKFYFIIPYLENPEPLAVIEFLYRPRGRKDFSVT